MANNSTDYKIEGQTGEFKTQDKFMDQSIHINPETILEQLKLHAEEF